jgi:hypothetical protein
MVEILLLESMPPSVVGAEGAPEKVAGVWAVVGNRASVALVDPGAA